MIVLSFSFLKRVPPLKRIIRPLKWRLDNELESESACGNGTIKAKSIKLSYLKFNLKQKQCNCCKRGLEQLCFTLGWLGWRWQGDVSSNLILKCLGRANKWHKHTLVYETFFHTTRHSRRSISHYYSTLYLRSSKTTEHRKGKWVCADVICIEGPDRNKYNQRAL